MPAHPRSGVERLKPKGLVAAHLIASHRSTPSSWQNIAISFTSAMLMCRYVFSSSLAISASRVDLALTTWSHSFP